MCGSIWWECGSVTVIFRPSMLKLQIVTLPQGLDSECSHKHPRGHAQSTLSSCKLTQRLSTHWNDPTFPAWRLRFGLTCHPHPPPSPCPQRLQALSPQRPATTRKTSVSAPAILSRVCGKPSTAHRAASGNRSEHNSGFCQACSHKTAAQTCSKTWRTTEYPLSS